MGKTLKSLNSQKMPSGSCHVLHSLFLEMIGRKLLFTVGTTGSAEALKQEIFIVMNTGHERKTDCKGVHLIVITKSSNNLP